MMMAGQWLGSVEILYLVTQVTKIIKSILFLAIFKKQLDKTHPRYCPITQETFKMILHPRNTQISSKVVHICIYSKGYHSKANFTLVNIVESAGHAENYINFSKQKKPLFLIYLMNVRNSF